MQIFLEGNFMKFLMRLPCSKVPFFATFAKINHYLREDSPLPPRRYCTIFAKVVSRGTYETEKTDL